MTFSEKQLPEGIDPELLAGLVPEADLLRWIEQAESAPEPGTEALGLNPETLRPQALLHKGDAGAAAGMSALALKSAGYARVWHTQTGEPSLVNRNTLVAQLRKRTETGVLAFTTHKPAIEPVRGKLACMLHPSKRPPEYDSMGLPTCRKANLPSDFQIRLHMQHRHKSSWETLEEMRLKRERDEQMLLQRQLLAAAVGQYAPESRTVTAYAVDDGIDTANAAIIAPAPRAPRAVKARRKQVRKPKATAPLEATG